MSTKISASERNWTAAELRRLPAEERDRILAATAVAAEDHDHDAALTAFEAFGAGDLYVQSADTQPR